MITEINNQAYRKAPGLGEILNSFTRAHSIAHRRTGKKMYARPQITSESALEVSAKNVQRTFVDFALNYFSNEGVVFEEYLRELNRPVKQVKGVGRAKMRNNAHLSKITQGDDVFIIQNENMDWSEGVRYLSGEYDVENSSMREYLMLHEHAHLSQNELKRDLSSKLSEQGLAGKELTLELNKALERDVEKTVLNYARGMYELTGQKKYEEIAGIAERRSEEVDWHYAK